MKVALLPPWCSVDQSTLISTYCNVYSGDVLVGPKWLSKSSNHQPKTVRNGELFSQHPCYYDQPKTLFENETCNIINSRQNKSYFIYVSNVLDCRSLWLDTTRVEHTLHFGKTDGKLWVVLPPVPLPSDVLINPDDNNCYYIKYAKDAIYRIRGDYGNGDIVIASS